MFPSRFVDDGKKSNSQSSRIITKRKNVDDGKSHSHGPNDNYVKIDLIYCGHIVNYSVILLIQGK